MADIGPKPLFHLYIDDSGTRHPNHKPGPNPHGDWFGLGGMLIAAEDDEPARDLHRSFCRQWGIDYPLHSVKIRNKTEEFLWLKADRERADRFLSGMNDLIAAMPVIGHACVIDRPGYNGRYREKYGRQQWSLCRTAFTVLCERAAKFAMKHDRRIKVFVERSDPDSDRMVKSYFREMRDVGMPFSKDESNKYGPLSPAELKYRLIDLEFKTKNCRMTQMADVLLYPICRSAYEDQYRPTVLMRAHKRIVDLHLDADEIPHIGVKFSCFDGK